MLSDAIFVFFWLIIAISAALAVFLQKPIYNAFAMACSIFSVAGMYIFLGYELLAALQVLVYVGAISVAIIFVIMLSPPAALKATKINPYKIIVGAGTSFAVLCIFFTMLYQKFGDARLDLNMPVQGIKQVGFLLATKFALPFELISVILLVAVLGAIVLAKKED